MLPSFSMAVSVDHAPYWRAGQAAPDCHGTCSGAGGLNRDPVSLRAVLFCGSACGRSQRFPYTFNARNLSPSADCMPRNAGPEMPEHQPHARGVEGATTGNIAPPYVRLTQRGSPPRERRRMWVLLAVVLAAPVLLAWIAYLILRPAPYQRNARNVGQILLIEPTSEPPAPPPLVPPPPLPGQPAPAPRRLPYVPPAKGAIRATLEGAKGQPLELYDQNGQIRLPSGTAQKPAPAPAYSAPGITGSHIYSGESPIPYKPTRFNKDWAPDKESLGAKTVGRAFEKAVEATTVKKTVKLPGGVKLHCAISPLLLMAGGAGCKGDNPPPPPNNDNDIRLSMPPAETLTGKKVPLPKSASSVAHPATATSGG
jgi:hypothetical protein